MEHTAAIGQAFANLELADFSKDEHRLQVRSCEEETACVYIYFRASPKNTEDLQVIVGRKSAINKFSFVSGIKK